MIFRTSLSFLRNLTFTRPHCAVGNDATGGSDVLRAHRECVAQLQAEKRKRKRGSVLRPRDNNDSTMPPLPHPRVVGSSDVSSTHRNEDNIDDDDASLSASSGKSDSSSASDDLAQAANGFINSEFNHASDDEDVDFGTDECFSEYDHAYDEAADKYSIQERIIHFLHPHLITSVSRPAVERAVVIEAGTIVTDDKTMDVAARNDLMLTSYKNILQAIPENMFQPVSLKDKMLAKLWQGKNDICGDRLWEKFKEVRSDLRTNYKFNDHNIPSGQQLRDFHDAWLVGVYRTENVSTLFASSFQYYKILI